MDSWSSQVRGTRDTAEARRRSQAAAPALACASLCLRCYLCRSVVVPSRSVRGVLHLLGGTSATSGTVSNSDLWQSSDFGVSWLRLKSSGWTFADRMFAGWTFANHDLTICGGGTRDMMAAPAGQCYRAMMMHTYGVLFEPPLTWNLPLMPSRVFEYSATTTRVNFTVRVTLAVTVNCPPPMYQLNHGIVETRKLDEHFHVTLRTGLNVLLVYTEDGHTQSTHTQTQPTDERMPNTLPVTHLPLFLLCAGQVCSRIISPTSVHAVWVLVPWLCPCKAAPNVSTWLAAPTAPTHAKMTSCSLTGRCSVPATQVPAPW